MYFTRVKSAIAKRQKTFQIATKQLLDLVNINVSLGNQCKSEFVKKFDSTIEALRDYEQAGKDLSEWLSKKQQNQ